MRSRRGRRFRSRKKSIKHVVDASSINGNFSTATVSQLLFEGVDNPDTDVPTDIATGHRLANLPNFEINASCAANFQAVGGQVVDWYVIFSPQDSLVLPPPTTVGQQTTKPYVFAQGMEMFNNGMGCAKKIGRIKIPSKYARFARGDRMYVVWKTRVNLGAVDSFCFKVIAKELIN